MAEERNDLEKQLAQLEEKRGAIPSKINMLRKKFNDELGFGSPEKAEEHRVEISKLEREGEALSLEIRRAELALKGIDHRGLV